MKPIHRMIVSAISLAAAGGAHAVPVNYDEALDGDISSSLTTSTAFYFDVGSNSIAGHVNVGAAGADFDTFEFTIGEGTRLSSVTLQFGAFEYTGPLTGFGSNYLIWRDFLGPQQALIQSTESVVGNYYDVLTTPALQSLFSVLPLDAGTYDWTHSMSRSAFSGTDFSQTSASWSYTLTFDVEAINVPEPGTVGIFFSGLMLLALSRRKSG